MANNLRYLLEHFCLDGQKIDISSQLDEENANNIEKINTQTIPNINARIDDIKNTDIPNINSRIDSIKNTDIPSINRKINTINNTTIPDVQENVNAVNDKADRINESVAKNTRDIGTLSDNVTMQGNAINSIETEKIPSVEKKVEAVAHETLRISAAHKHDINGIGESLSALQSETSSNTTNIENLTTNVNGLTTKVNTNTDSINDLTTKVNTNTDSINTINNTTIPDVQENVNAVNDKADRINESVAKNTRDIGTLSNNVTMQGNAINSIETEKIPSVEKKVETVAHETLRISAAHKHDINGIGESLSALQSETSSNTTNIENLTTNVNGLTTKVNTNTDSINGLTTKVNNNTDSINTINNTSIPHLQSEIDNLSGGGTGSVGELREKVEKNTSDISELNRKVDTNTADISTLSGKVDTNTTAISTINDTSIPHLQNEIDKIKSIKPWELIKETTVTDIKNVIYNIKIYSNGIINYLYVNCDFKNVTEPTTAWQYGVIIDDITPPYNDIFLTSIVLHLYRNVGTLTLFQTYDNKFKITLTLSTVPSFTGFPNVTTGLFYFS